MTSTDQRSALTVVALAPRRPAVEPDCFDALRAYWTALCTGRIMPDRKDIDPRGLAGLLDKVFLVERIAPAQARFRVAGQHLAEVTGCDPRGMPLTSLFTPAARPWIEEALQSVFDDPATVDLVLQGPRTGLLGRMAAGRMTILPLRGPDGQVTRAIGCVASSRVPGKAPERFNIVGENRQTLIGYGRPKRHDTAIEPAFAAAESARDRIRHRKEMRRQLRVVAPE